jgi:CDP-glucose 4,6-dehydratase
VSPAAEGRLGTPAFWLDRPVLVTGATGLVGGALVSELLALRADVVCLVRDWVPQSEVVRSRALERVKVVRGDVRDGAMLERALGEYEVDSVLHLAAQTIVPIANRNPRETFDTNVGGTAALLEAARRSPTVRQIVIASSDKAYGEQPTPYDESAPLLGAHPYDASKACADIVAQSYARTYRSPVAITRCGNFYGGGDLNWNRIVPGTIRSVLRGKPPVIRSDGRLIRDYIYVRDAVGAYLLLAEALAERPELAGEAFNFSNEKPLSVREIVDLILRLMDARVEPEVRNEASHEIPIQSLSAAKARRVLGWRPRYTLEEGLRETIEWYRELLLDRT